MIYNVFKENDGLYYFKGMDSHSKEIVRSIGYPTQAGAKEIMDEIVKVLAQRGRDSINKRKGQSGRKYFTIKSLEGSRNLAISTEFYSDAELVEAIESLLK